MSLATVITARIAAIYTLTLDLGTSRADVELDASSTLETGTASSLADLIFQDTRSIALSSSETLDLYGGLTDPFGTTLNFAKIKAILIKAASTNTNNVVVGAAATNQFLGPLVDSSDKISIPPGGMILLTAPVSGWAVANGVTDNLKIANSGAGSAVSYNIVLVGTSA